MPSGAVRVGAMSFRIFDGIPMRGESQLAALRPEAATVLRRRVAACHRLKPKILNVIRGSGSLRSAALDELKPGAPLFLGQG